MRRHVVAGHFGVDDSDAPALREGEFLTRLDMVVRKKMLGHGVGEAIVRLAELDVCPTEVGVDLLVLAAHVHASDTRISRDEESQDGWTRELRLLVPVHDPALWAAAAPIFERMLNFLTGDHWKLEFRARPAAFKNLAPAANARLFGAPFDGISLFSGGLDSLIGAVDALEAGKKPLLVSHAGEGAVSDAQTTIFEALKSHYRESTFERLRVWMTFKDGLVEASPSENTTRGRSFLFFALGAFAGTGLERPFTLRVPENGLISVNVPLDPLRLGALSTRTTHPFYIARWNDALAKLGIAGRIENPYWDRTKGEMVKDCSNPILLRELIPLSLSCASPAKIRFKGLGSQHCGYCLPCLIRRASLRKGLHPDADPSDYYIDDLSKRSLNTKQAEGIQVRSFQLAIERLRLKPALASVLIHKPGPLSDESAQRQIALADVYRRGLAEVGELLAGVETLPG